MPPRPLRPKNEPAASETGESSSEPRSGKRKAVSYACKPCRKRKSKCDGQLPSCSTCIAVYRTECVYDSDIDPGRKGSSSQSQSPSVPPPSDADSDLQRKAPSRPEKLSTFLPTDASEVIVSVLKSLPESESIALLKAVRTTSNIAALADTIRGNTRFPLIHSPQPREGNRFQEITPQSNSSLEALPYPGSHPPLPSRHGRVTFAAKTLSIWLHDPQDPDVIEHLVSLYFSWINPFYGFLWETHFLHDMSRGRSEFCSSLLVNAVLSFACHYSERRPGLSDPNDPATAGDQFYTEAKRLLGSDDTPCLTTVQALGIMSLREASAGRESSGYQMAGRCVRMALELGLHLSMMKNASQRVEAEVRKTTFWAVFNLETMFAMSFGRVSQLPRAATDVELPSTNTLLEPQTWRPYDDSGSVHSESEQPENQLLFADQLSKLSELASGMTDAFYASRERFNARRLAATYAQYQEWYGALPDMFRLEHTALPHVIVLHMHYFACVLHLFRPYIKLDLRGANLFPRDTCTICANEISALMSMLRSLYGLRRVCFDVTGVVLSACTIHLLNLPSEPATSHLVQSLHDLGAMSANHPFATKCVDIIRSLSSKWRITLPELAAAMMSYGTTSHSEPSSHSESPFFAATIPRHPSTRGHNRPGDVSPSAFETSVSTPLDPSPGQTEFWTPFPTQGIPTLPHDMGAAAPVPNLTPYGGHQHQWQMFGAPAGQSERPQQRQQAHLDEDMDEMGAWPWQ